MTMFYTMLPKYVEPKSLRSHAALEGLTIGTDYRKVVILPLTKHCSLCGASYSAVKKEQEHTAHWPLTQAEEIDEKHPLFEKIRKVSKQLSDERMIVTNNLMERVHRGEDVPDDDPWALRQTNAGRMSPKNFDELEREVRETLNLRAEQAVRPGQRLGFLSVKIYTLDLPDFCDFEPSSSCQMVVKERVIRVLEEANCRGWKSFPVKITRIKTRNKNVPLMKELIVTGRAKPKKPVLLEHGLKCETCQSCGYERCMLDEGFEKIKLEGWDWDGSDLFYTDYTSGLCVTEKVKTAFESNQITGVKFKPISV